MLQFLLTHNKFQFDGKFYCQAKGTAMGTKCSPAYANLYLGAWKDWLFSGGVSETSLARIQSWHRYIDDVFVLWTGTPEETELFVSELGADPFNLTFTRECSCDKITFLDLIIQITDRCTLNSKLYRKSTAAANSLLHAERFHPRALVRGIPIGQYLRVRRNCCTERDFEVEAKNLRKIF